MSKTESVLPLFSVLGTVIVFLTVKYGTKRLLPNYVDEKHKENISCSVTSIIQAIVITLLSLIYILSDIKELVHILIYIASTTFTVELFTSNIIRRDMVIHHVISIVLSVCLIYQTRRSAVTGDDINYNLYGQVGLVEISSIFLNAKYILKNMVDVLGGKSTSILMSPIQRGNNDTPVERLYHSANMLFIGSFFLFRTAFLPYLTITNIWMLKSNTIAYLLFLLFVVLNLAWSRMIWRKWNKKT